MNKKWSVNAVYFTWPKPKDFSSQIRYKSPSNAVSFVPFFQPVIYFGMICYIPHLSLSLQRLSLYRLPFLQFTFSFLTNEEHIFTAHAKLATPLQQWQLTEVKHEHRRRWRTTCCIRNSVNEFKRQAALHQVSLDLINVTLASLKSWDSRSDMTNAKPSILEMFCFVHGLGSNADRTSGDWPLAPQSDGRQAIASPRVREGSFG